jgi:uncharacterized protein with LGFP repeats
VYWTAAGGAQPVGGAVLGRYLALGEADGVLGWPVSGEEPEPGGVRARFAGGRVYWSAGTGARALYGAVLQAYLDDAGPAGPLGLPTEEEVTLLDGRRARFVGGGVYWSPSTGAHPLSGGIAEKYRALGEAAGPVGWPVAAEEDVAGGRQSRFSAGLITWSAATGAHEVHGALLAHWLELAGAGGFLGLPTSDELGVTGGRASSFVGGTLYWSAGTGAHEVHGAILGRYLQGGGPDWIGLPTADEVPVTGGARSDFQSASLLYRAATGEVAVVPR